ncbi:MAG: hypothetical protein ABI867_36470 [Kofleriaceae bacterium]
MTKLFVIAMLLGACGSSGSPTGIETLTCETPTTLTYENFGAALVEDACLECHRGKESPSLTTQALLQANADDVLDNAVYTDAMPEGNDGMTLEERRMLGEWLACGAP